MEKRREKKGELRRSFIQIHYRCQLDRKRKRVDRYGAATTFTKQTDRQEDQPQERT